MKKRRFLNNRGYFFLIDSMLALGVLGIGMFLIFTSYTNTPFEERSAAISDDTMDFFAGNKLKEIDNKYAGLNGELWQTESQPTGLCPGEDLKAKAESTLLQQVAEFYERSKSNPCYLDLAEKFIANLTISSIPPQFMFEFWVDNTRLYPKNASQQHIDSKAAAIVIIPSKKIVHGTLNQQTGDLFGPYGSEVIIWQ